VAEALADDRPLVCYDCGIACDLGAIRQDRLASLRALGALEPRGRRDPSAAEAREHRVAASRRPGACFADSPYATYRIRYTKLGRAAYLGHLDTARALARAFRRAGVSMAYTRGFHPKPRMKFTPPLALGVQGLSEYADVGIEGDWQLDELRERLRRASPPGNHITAVWKLEEKSPGLGKLVTAYDLLILPAPRAIASDALRLERLVRAFLARPRAEVDRKGRPVDVRALVVDARAISPDAVARACGAFGWTSLLPESPAAEGATLLWARVTCTPAGSAKPSEVAMALGGWGPEGEGAERALLARLGFRGVESVPESTRALAPGGDMTTLSYEHLVPTEASQS
jgi:radical SAM-linked protein